MSYRILIRNEDEWVTRAEGRRADWLINDLGAIPLLRLLSDGKPVCELDLRAVVDQAGEVICLRASEDVAAEMIEPGDSRSIVPARIEPVGVAAALVIAKP